MSEPSSPTVPGTGHRTVVVFAGHDKYLVGGGKPKAIQVRRVADGQQLTTLEVEDITCLAASTDGRWIAAGTANGDVLLWDAKTYERVFELKEPLAINDVDFFYDSARFFASHNRATTVWNIASGQQVQRFDHEGGQIPARSLPEGGAFAVAAENSIRVYDDYDSRLLAVIPVRVATVARFLSLGDHLVAISGDKIKKFEWHTGATVAEWIVPYSEHSRIAVPGHRLSVAYCARHTVTFWDASTHAQIGFVDCPLEVSSIAFSPDDQLLAISGLEGEVVIRDLRAGSPPCIHFAGAVFEDTLGDTQASSTDTISTSRHQSNHTSITIPLVRVLIKRSKVYVADGLWELALDDANKVIELDPLSPWGYERKHAALYKAGDYDNAFNAFEVMLSRMSLSSSPRIHELHRHYINPTDTRVAIRRAVQDAIRDSPPVLIDTASGRLLDKSEQAILFESLPVFKKLISSMTTIIDHPLIEYEVKQYYRYATLSHTWQHNEPLFEQVIRVIVYDLEDSPANNKLKMFCTLVREAGFHWAWSDTCCINRKDDSVLQEALVAMFRWYQGSASTLVLLHGVQSPSQYGDLIKSMWNTRAWAFQEYHASKVVWFYNEDWTLYGNIAEPNHKGSIDILSEMEEATGISTRALEALQPGLDNIWKKLHLVSRRETTLVEDEAYSLLGIFALSLPIAYGDGDGVLGQLLARILSNSGDASILAWVGKSGSFNSCLPGRIRVFSQLPTSHIPSPMTDAEMEAITATLETSSLNLDLVMNFYGRLERLPAPSFLGRRMRLPCLSFRLESLLVSRAGSEQVFSARTTGLGKVEIRTTEDLSELDSLTLVHPWIDFLLGQQPEERSDDDPDKSSGKLTPPQPLDMITTALRVIARLRQPFGALLLAPTGQDVAEYRRVASESLITVQVRDDTLDYLMDSIRILDIV